MTRDLNREKNLKKRSLILGLAKGFFTFVVFGKLYYLQILKKSKYGKLSDLNRTKIKILYPERGKIFDLNGVTLASNRTDFQLTLFREKKELLNRYISRLQEIMFFSENDFNQLKKNLKSENLSDFIIVKKNLTWSELEIFELMSNKFPFLLITKEKVRNYSNDLIFSHVLGYVGYKTDVKDKKLINQKVGISGIEQILDKNLVGSQGWIKLETNSAGRIKKELKKKYAIPGKNTTTNLISEIQEEAFSQLGGISGAAVMINCLNGGINCLVSTPSFDNNEFSNGVSNLKWQALLNDHSKPLLNRCVGGLYSPGSTYKLISALYALEKLKVDKYKNFYCKGFVKFGPRKFHCWKKEGHGEVDLFNAIKKSCDCYFYNLAKDIKNIDSLAQFSKEFSLGVPSGIDIPNELNGLMPDKAWKISNRGEKWQKGETLNTIIGQGFTLSTPLQMTLMTSRIASGKKIKPSIIRNDNTFFENLNFHSTNLDFIRKSMFSVVNDYDGTAFRSKLDGKYFMAGKTGTSQVRRISKEEREKRVLKNEELEYELRDHSIFTCYAPFENPKFALTVVAEHMGSGSKVAAPIAKNIMELALRKFL